MFQLNIYTPLSQETPTAPRQLLARLDNAVTDGNFDCDIAGGYSGAHFTLKPGWLDTVPPGAHIEVRENGSVRWEGMRLRPKYAGRHIVGLEARGYALALTDCNPWETDGLTAPSYDAATIIARAMAQCVPPITVGAIWQQPEISHPLSDFNDRTPWQVQQQLCAESGYDWQVWEGLQMSLVARTPPAVGSADYQVAIEDCTDWEPDDSSVFTRITVKYTDASTGAAAETQQFVNGVAEEQQGVVRANILNIGTTNAAGAAAYAQAKLLQTATPQIRAVIGPVSRLRRTAAIGTPASQVRPGEWVQIGAAEEQSRPPQVIVHTSVAWKTGMGTFQLGAPKLDIVGSIVSMQRVTSAVVMASNPLSGAPA